MSFDIQIQSSRQGCRLGTPGDFIAGLRCINRQIGFSRIHPALRRSPKIQQSVRCGNDAVE
jgi:hypothetical protein